MYDIGENYYIVHFLKSCKTSFPGCHFRAKKAILDGKKGISYEHNFTTVLSQVKMEMTYVLMANHAMFCGHNVIVYGHWSVCTVQGHWSVCRDIGQSARTL